MIVGVWCVLCVCFVLFVYVAVVLKGLLACAGICLFELVCYFRLFVLISFDLGYWFRCVTWLDGLFVGWLLLWFWFVLARFIGYCLWVGLHVYGNLCICLRFIIDLLWFRFVWFMFWLWLPLYCDWFDLFCFAVWFGSFSWRLHWFWFADFDLFDLGLLVLMFGFDFWFWMRCFLFWMVGFIWLDCKFVCWLDLLWLVYLFALWDWLCAFVWVCY